MIFIFTIAKALLLPPGCLVLGLLLLIFFVPRRCKFFLGLLAAFLYVLSIQPFADLLLRPIEDTYPPLLPAAFAQNAEVWDDIEAIVVLGGGTIQNSPEAGAGRDTLTPGAMKRAAYAFSLRDYFPVPIVFSGGKVFDHYQESEADTAGRFFVSLGLPAERLILETNSRNTWENARETANLGFKNVILVTSAFHMPRSVFCFERAGISVIPAPTDYILNRGQKYNLLRFLPSIGSLSRTYMALHEYIGLLAYRVVYRRQMQ